MGEGDAATGRVVIVMPTYNERQNLEVIAGRIREAVPDADLLVVDDNSPDGTGDLADKLAEADPRVQVMHRTEKAGLGRAYVAGFTWALDGGALDYQFVRDYLRRNWGYYSQATPEQIHAGWGFAPVLRWTRRGQWIEVYEVNTGTVAAVR